MKKLLVVILVILMMAICVTGDQPVPRGIQTAAASKARQPSARAKGAAAPKKVHSGPSVG